MKVVYLPLDERPCNSQFALRIAKGSPVQIIAPPFDILGNKKVPANWQKVQQFLLDNAQNAQCFVIAIDMLLYGGIVPSRLHHLSQSQLLERLSILDTIKKLNPTAKIYAFALITRCPNYSSADEEPDYYEFCGREIFLTGQVKHKMQLGLLDEAQGLQLLSQYGAVTKQYLADFESRRQVNRQMLVSVAQKLGNSIDYLVLPQDDSAPYGYTTMDREFLVGEFAKQGKNISMYPGADEVGMTLLARAVCDFFGKQPKIYCQYPQPQCKNVIPMYEDRPIEQTLPFQVHSAGCVFANEEEADIYLYLNYPTEQPVSVGDQLSVGYEKRDLPQFCKKIAQSVAQHKLVAVADCALCNGGEMPFVQMLAQQFDLFSLCAYAGWNTSSNTLGTVICQSVFNCIFGKTEQQNNFLAERFFEDVGYCGYIRKYITDNILPSLGLDYFNAGDVDGVVAQIVREQLTNYLQNNLPTVANAYVLDMCQMPWKRMFEVNLTTKRSK